MTKMPRVALLSTIIALTILTLIASVFPGQILRYIPIASLDEEVARQAFSLVNATLLALLGILFGRVILSTPSSIDIDDARNAITESVDSGYLRYRDPASKALVLDNFPSFKDTSQILRIVNEAAILANLRPEHTNSLRDISNAIKNERIEAILCDEEMYPEVMRFAKQSSIAVYALRPASQNSIPNVGPKSARIAINTLSYGNKERWDLAALITQSSFLDTTKYPGFHGNWCGTYGLFSFRMDENLNTEGWYYYAKGKIKGKARIDITNKRVILDFDWSQTENASGTGSMGFGQGQFVLPAGYDFFIGYWADKGIQETGQPWCASRLARVIGNQARSGEPPFGVDFGLSLHDRKNIVES
jgi:hypothetical protein